MTQPVYGEYSDGVYKLLSVGAPAAMRTAAAHEEAHHMLQTVAAFNRYLSATKALIAEDTEWRDPGIWSSMRGSATTCEEVFATYQGVTMGRHRASLGSVSGTIPADYMQYWNVAVRVAESFTGRLARVALEAFVRAMMAPPALLTAESEVAQGRSTLLRELLIDSPDQRLRRLLVSWDSGTSTMWRRLVNESVDQNSRDLLAKPIGELLSPEQAELRRIASVDNVAVLMSPDTAGEFHSRTVNRMVQCTLFEEEIILRIIESFQRYSDKLGVAVLGPADEVLCFRRPTETRELESSSLWRPSSAASPVGTVSIRSSNRPISIVGGPEMAATSPGRTAVGATAGFGLAVVCDKAWLDAQCTIDWSSIGSEGSIAMISPAHQRGLDRHGSERMPVCAGVFDRVGIVDHLVRHRPVGPAVLLVALSAAIAMGERFFEFVRRSDRAWSIWLWADSASDDALEVCRKVAPQVAIDVVKPHDMSSVAALVALAVRSNGATGFVIPSLASIVEGPTMQSIRSYFGDDIRGLGYKSLLVNRTPQMMEAMSIMDWLLASSRWFGG